MPTDRQQEALALIAQGLSRRQVAERMGIHLRTLRKLMERYRKAENADPAVREAMQRTGMEQVPHSGWIKRWNSEDGRGESLYFKTEPDPAAIAEIVAEALADVPAVKPTPAPARVEADLAHVLPIADHHAGMHAWGRETGADYSIRIARDVLLEGASDLIARADPAAECVILNLGDLYHADDQQNVTPRSKHQLDVDSRFAKIIAAGVDMIAGVIDMAAQRFGRVRYDGRPGNHDPHSGVWLTLALAQRYRDHPRVVIEREPGAWWCWEWGRNLIVATHGDKVKPDRLAQFIPAEWPDAWGRTRHRWALTGHIHHERVREYPGLTWESLRTLAPRDAHARASGYWSRQTLTLRTLHRQDGEVERRMRTFEKERYREQP